MDIFLQFKFQAPHSSVDVVSHLFVIGRAAQEHFIAIYMEVQAYVRIHL